MTNSQQRVSSASFPTEHSPYTLARICASSESSLSGQRTTTRHGWLREKRTAVSNWWTASPASVLKPRCSTKLTWVAFASSVGGEGRPSAAAPAHIWSRPPAMESTETSIPGSASKIEGMGGQGWRHAWPRGASRPPASLGPHDPAGYPSIPLRPCDRQKRSEEHTSEL